MTVGSLSSFKPLGVVIHQNPSTAQQILELEIIYVLTHQTCVPLLSVDVLLYCIICFHFHWTNFELQYMTSMKTLWGTRKAIQENMQNSFPMEKGCNSWVFNRRWHLLTQTVSGILHILHFCKKGWGWGVGYQELFHSKYSNLKVEEGYVGGSPKKWQPHNGWELGSGKSRQKEDIIDNMWMIPNVNFLFQMIQGI